MIPKPDSTKSDGQLSSPALSHLISGLSGSNGPTPRYQNLTTWLNFHTPRRPSELPLTLPCDGSRGSFTSKAGQVLLRSIYLLWFYSRRLVIKPRS